ncbi:unnamed protein product [Lactuca saligna]|uniref:Uncharacterized protein n=1 Tax=Lactuca saligna TaxID=75948 RepID=A0AA36DY79_LACSI|nr:unnamed protein product [Lactuca saligna]
MSKPLYEFGPNTNIITGPHTPNSIIIIQWNNVEFSDEILKQFANSGIEDFVNYVKSGPLQYAFCDFPDPFCHKQLMNVPYPCWLRLILSREVGSVESHGIIIQIPALSSKIINVAPSERDMPITTRM